MTLGILIICDHGSEQYDRIGIYCTHALFILCLKVYPDLVEKGAITT